MVSIMTRSSKSCIGLWLVNLLESFPSLPNVQEEGGPNKILQVTAIGVACVYATLHPRFRHPTLRPWRAAMYAGLGLSAIVFIIHGLLIHGWEIQKHRMSLEWMALMGGLNITGALSYACRVCLHCFCDSIQISFNLDIGSREMVPSKTRYLWEQPSDTSFYGHLRWARTYVRITKCIRLHSLRYSAHD